MAMESKSRRAPRTMGPIDAPAALPKPVEFPAAAIGAAKASSEPPIAAEIIAEARKPAETALNLVETAVKSISETSIGAVAETAKSTAPADRAEFDDDVVAAFAQSQAALARGLEALSAEMAGLALSGINAAARTATKMLAVKTLSDAIEVNAGFACSNLDALVGGSATLSQLGAKVAAETSQPLLKQFGKGWIKMGGLGS
jgi:Phasin protein